LFRPEDHVSGLDSRDRAQKDIKREKLHHLEVLANHRMGYEQNAQTGDRLRAWFHDMASHRWPSGAARRTPAPSYRKNLVLASDTFDADRAFADLMPLEPNLSVKSRTAGPIAKSDWMARRF
jgi:hypothetical protein